MIRGVAFLLGICLLNGSALAAGAACVSARIHGQTLDYALEFTQGHVSQAQDAGIAALTAKGYADYYRGASIIHPQNLTNLPHAYVVVIRSEFVDARGRERSLIGCGFDAQSYDAALWDALRDGQQFFWAWKPDRDGYQVIKKVRY